MLIQDTISIKRRSTKSQEFRLTIGNNFGMLMYVNNYVVTYSFNWKIGRYDNPFHPKLSKIQTYKYLTQQLHYKIMYYVNIKIIRACSNIPLWIETEYLDNIIFIMYQCFYGLHHSTKKEEEEYPQFMFCYYIPFDNKYLPLFVRVLFCQNRKSYILDRNYL